MTAAKKKESFPSRVWNTLSTTDCSEMVEKKGQLSYLSWANAWTSLMNVYPESTFAYMDDIRLPNGTVEVHVVVTVKEGEDILQREMHLPVMNYKNVAIVDPDSRDISDNKMRCLVKCIALFGLGLFLYRGEDIPQQREARVVAKKAAGKPATPEQLAKIKVMREQDAIPIRTLAWLDKNISTLTDELANRVINQEKSE